MNKIIVFCLLLLLTDPARAEESSTNPPAFLAGVWARPDCGHAQNISAYREHDMITISSAGLRVIPLTYISSDAKERRAQVRFEDGSSYDVKTSVDGILMSALTPSDGAPDPLASEDDPALEKSTHCVEIFTDDPVVKENLDQNAGLLPVSP